MIRFLSVLLIAGLVGCGGSGDDDAVDTTTEDNITEPVVTDTDTGSQDATLLFGPPQVLLGECGTTEISGAEADNSTPTPMFLNQIVQGQLLVGSTVLDADLWEITLDAGNYHLVSDVSLANGDRGVAGLIIDSVTPEGDVELVRASRGGTFDLRTYEFLELDVAQTLTLRVEPLGGEIQSYQLAIYPNGTPVPSPRLTLCPSVTVISLDETQTVPDFNAVNNIDDFRWFSVDVPADNYNVDVTGSTTADSGVIAYEFDLFEQFAESGMQRSLGNPSEAIPNNGQVLSTTFEFTTSESGVVWIRTENQRETINMEFTISSF